MKPIVGSPKWGFSIGTFGEYWSSTDSVAGRYGVTVVADDAELVDDPTGDSLDALLCAVQAAWVWRNRAKLFGSPRIDRKGGWIADPQAV